MVNDDLMGSRGGLIPYAELKRARYYRITTGVAAMNFFLGMPVDLDSTGRVATIELTASNNALVGSIIGFSESATPFLSSIPSSMQSLTQGSYLPGNTDAWALVADHPDQEFMIQETTAGTALAETNIGNNANLGYRSSSGSTVTGWSTAELIRSSAGTGTGGLVMIRGLVRYVNTDGTDNAFGNYAKLAVQIVRHRYSPMSLGPGGTQL